jgi:hypothetical protein
MTLNTIKNFERRWMALRRLASAQLKDLDKDRKQIARQVKQYKVKKDVARLKVAVAQSKAVEKATQATKKFIAARDRMVREASASGRKAKKGRR